MGLAIDQTGTRHVVASQGDRMWDYWQATPAVQQPTWTQFQKDFRHANPSVAQDGHLEVGDGYDVPTYIPVQERKTDQSGSSTDNPPLTGPADGSAQNKAIQIAPGKALDFVSFEQAAEVLAPDAFVIAVRGKIGVQDIPGWDKIPGLKNLGKDAEVGYLLATLTPMDPKGLNPNFSPKDTTVFLSLNVPGHQPVVLTVKVSDLTAEAGRPIKNLVDKPGGIIWFSNARAGGSLEGDDVASVNGGILFELPGLKDTADQIKGLVKKVARSAQAAQIGTGLVTAPESGGTSLIATAGALIGTEMLRGTLDNSLDKAKWYAGFAWRGETRLINEDGTVTLQARKGALEGKWITFNVKDVADDFFGGNIPDFANANKQWLVNSGMEQERADMMAKGVGDGMDLHKLMDQTAAYLKISTPELIEWFNQQDKHWVASFAYMQMRMLSPDESGTFSTQASRGNMRYQPSSIPDLAWLAELQGHRMPQGS